MSTNHNPQSFGQVFAAYSLIDPLNATVSRLSRDIDAQICIIKELAKSNQSRFINLITRANQARIVMCVYAGDGIVSKITPENYLSSYGDLPLVMPPFEERRVRCGKHDEVFILQNFPLLDTKNISPLDVEKMRGMLAESGLEFKTNDDKPDNIGRLPDGSLAVLDGDAVKPKANCDLQALREKAGSWKTKIYGIFPMLYAPGYHFTQTPETSFEIKSRVPVTTLISEREKPAAKVSWYKRIGIGNNQEIYDTSHHR